MGGGCPSPGDLGGRGMESGPFRVGLEDEASVKGGVVQCIQHTGFDSILELFGGVGKGMGGP